MDLKIGDKVKVRSPKDLWCEYGPKQEPYVPLTFNLNYIEKTGEIKRINTYRNHTIVDVFYTGYGGWWYYPEVLIKVEETD